MKDFLKLIICIAGCELVGVLGAFFTTSAITDWYAYLNKPFFSPPNWIFGPVWTILYFLMGVSLYLVLQNGIGKKSNNTAIKFFMTQLGLNFIWSPVFFGLRAPFLGLVTILVMWVLIVLTIRKFYKISKTASYLLIPYLIWVSFATILNAAIFLLN